MRGKGRGREAKGWGGKENKLRAMLGWVILYIRRLRQQADMMIACLQGVGYDKHGFSPFLHTRVVDHDGVLTSIRCMDVSAVAINPRAMRTCNSY